MYILWVGEWLIFFQLVRLGIRGALSETEEVPGNLWCLDYYNTLVSPDPIQIAHVIDEEITMTMSQSSEKYFK